MMNVIRMKISFEVKPQDLLPVYMIGVKERNQAILSHIGDILKM